IQQQVAGGALGRACVGAAAIVQVLLAGNLGATAVAAQLATADVDVARETRAVIGPEHHFAAVAVDGGAGLDRDAGVHVHLGGVAQRRIATLPAAADVDVAAAGGAAGVQLRTAV